MNTKRYLAGLLAGTIAIMLGVMCLYGGITAYKAITSNRAAYLDLNGQIQPSDVTATELGYLSGVTSALQTQLNAKAGSTGGITNGTYSGGTFTSPTNSLGRYTNGVYIGGTYSSQTNTDLISSGLAAADANQKLVGKTAAQAKLILGIDSGTATASADGTVTQSFGLTFLAAPIVTIGSVATNENSHVLSTTETNCVLGTLTAGTNINWIAIGTP